MYHVRCIMSGDQPPNDAASEALCQLETYLETGVLVEHTPIFTQPRSERVDRLLCSWAFDGQEVSGELLAELHEVPLIATPAEVEQLSRGWAAAAAALVHPRPRFQGRLNAYLHSLLALQDRPGAFGGRPDAPELDDEELPIYVTIEVGTRSRQRSMTATPRALESVVRSWAPDDAGSSFRLDALGELLTNAPAGEDRE
jgi:hypothetical protein